MDPIKVEWLLSLGGTNLDDKIAFLGPYETAVYYYFESEKCVYEDDCGDRNNLPMTDTQDDFLLLCKALKIPLLKQG